MENFGRPRVEESFESIYPHLRPDAPLELIFDAPIGDDRLNVKQPQPLNGASDHAQASPVSEVPHLCAGPDSLASAVETAKLHKYAANGFPEVYARPALPYSDKLANVISQRPLDLRRDVPRLVNHEYEMDETDAALMGYIITRYNVEGMTAAVFERIMSIIDTGAALITLKFPAKKAAVDGIDDTQQCSICLQAESENSNSIVFCDGCDIGVHQDCYGVPFIPEGQWLCRKCQFARGQNISCMFCPWKSGAFKQTDTHQWAHVVCGLWIPEAIVPDDAFMEPISGIYNVPKDRWRLLCYICKQRVGACLQCSHQNCYQAFHPTCAQAAGLYMHAPGGTVGALESPQLMRQYCDKHTPPGVKIYIDIAAVRKSFEIEQKKGTESDSLFAIPRYPYWRTDSGVMAVPHALVELIKEQAGIDLDLQVIHLLCRYWTVKKDNQGTMFSRHMKLNIETAQHISTTRLDHALEYDEIKKKLIRHLALAKKMLKLVESDRQQQIEKASPKIDPKQTVSASPVKRVSVKKEATKVSPETVDAGRRPFARHNNNNPWEPKPQAKNRTLNGGRVQKLPKSNGFIDPKPKSKSEPKSESKVSPKPAQPKPKHTQKQKQKQRPIPKPVAKSAKSAKSATSRSSTDSSHRQLRVRSYDFA